MREKRAGILAFAFLSVSAAVLAMFFVVLAKCRRQFARLPRYSSLVLAPPLSVSFSPPWSVGAAATFPLNMRSTCLALLLLRFLLIEKLIKGDKNYTCHRFSRCRRSTATTTTTAKHVSITRTHTHTRTPAYYTHAHAHVHVHLPFTTSCSLCLSLSLPLFWQRRGVAVAIVCAFQWNEMSERDSAMAS